MSQEKPKRRWYQFSLRTMLIVMVLASAAFGYWVRWSKEWIRQRHELQQAVFVMWYITDKENAPRAPAGLWLFGEKGISTFWVTDDDEDGDGARAVKRLYPEATIKLGLKSF